MNSRKVFIIIAVVVIVAGAGIAIFLGLGRSELSRVSAATEGFMTVEAAEAAGFVNVNVEDCIASPEGTMGYHFVNFDRVDLELDPLEPEILVFVPDGQGGMRLGAVEYAVPIEPWDAVNDEPPTVLGQFLHPNPELGLYVLHAWVHEENPSGMFADWNPNVSCGV